MAQDSLVRASAFYYRCLTYHSDTKGDAVNPILDLMDKNRKNYEDRVRVLEENRENEIRRSELVRTKFDETIRQIERQHSESSSSLDRKKRQRVKELVESFHQILDPSQKL